MATNKQPLETDIDVAVAGKGGHTKLSMPEDGGDSDTDGCAADAIDIVVYFAKSVGLQLKVSDGQNLTASELFEDVMEEQHYPHEARQLFSLWLVSDLLELQLKPTHIPFKLVCYWEELLEKYSMASEYDRQRDEPIIAFRRNVYCPLDVEKQILAGNTPNTLEMLCLVYHEAKKNVLSGRYPLTLDECDNLAGLQVLITDKEQQQATSVLEPLEDSLEYFRRKMLDYLPAHYCKRNRLFSTSKNPERRLYDNYHRERDANLHTAVEHLYMKYLQICWDKPYYGSAFFRGEVEHPGRRLLSTKIDDPVYVAINTEGVYVIDRDDFVMLIGLPYRHLCWERAQTADEQNAAQCLPCLFLQFPVSAVKGHETSTDTQVFQIFSRETILMDRLIEACVNLKKTQQSSEPEVGHEYVIHGHGEEVRQFQRLALMTFTHDHKPVGKSSIRMPKTAPSVAT